MKSAHENKRDESTKPSQKTVITFLNMMQMNYPLDLENLKLGNWTYEKDPKAQYFSEKFGTFFSSAATTKRLIESAINDIVSEFCTLTQGTGVELKKEDFSIQERRLVIDAEKIEAKLQAIKENLEVEKRIIYKRNAFKENVQYCIEQWARTRSKELSNSDRKKARINAGDAFQELLKYFQALPQFSSVKENDINEERVGRHCIPPLELSMSTERAEKSLRKANGTSKILILRMSKNFGGACVSLLDNSGNPKHLKLWKDQRGDFHIKDSSNQIMHQGSLQVVLMSVAKHHGIELKVPELKPESELYKPTPFHVKPKR